MSASGNTPFSPRAVLGMLLFGALAFLLTLYFIGIDETGTDTNNGGAHAAAKGLNGYAALADLATKSGNAVVMNRNEAGLTSPGLLIATPPHGASPEDLAKLVNERRYTGPTIVVLPKWNSMPVEQARKDTKPGWVDLGSPQSPSWAGFMDNVTVSMGKSADWSTPGVHGTLPVPMQVQTGAADNLVPLVTSGEDERVLAGFIADDGHYPALNTMGGYDPQLGGEDDGIYPIILVFEPDLLNNYGMAKQANAIMASQLIKAAQERSTTGVTFDLTLNGLGRSMNLLTLAFTPPFLAATLCLIIAAIVVGWRAFRRFGPPLAEARAIAFGKRQLVKNAAGFIRRTRRLHLLGPPYAALMRRRIARALGLHWQDDSAVMDDRIEAALTARGNTQSAYAGLSQTLGHARNETELLRAAEALKQIERMLGK